MANRNLPVTDRKVNFETSPISRLTLGKSAINRRKYSFPAALHANLLGLSHGGNNEPLKEVNQIAKRRFSNVGDVVSRKLSNTIGWRSYTVSLDEVITQGKVLCAIYMRNRLKRTGIFNKKLGLYRVRSMIGTTSGTTIREVYPCLIAAGMELERMHSKLYNNIARQASSTPGGVLVSEKTAAGLLVAISHELFKNEINWAKIVSIYAVSGGLAVDSVCQGHPEYLHALMEAMSEILEGGLADWIAANGGWVTFCNFCKIPDSGTSLLQYSSTAAIIITVLLVIYVVIRFVKNYTL